MPQVEILAPAGSMDSFLAAVNAKADAVYVGGNMFGARAFANNFTTEELSEAIKYAHIHGSKVYLTVNTLLKNNEIKNELYDFLKPIYDAGLDAVIVQDLGVLSFIRKNFPQLDIHASTQMTSTGPYGAKLLESLGATRVVTSRELNLKEIKAIRDNCSLEIESFVHGALCYCYSGQCLMSSYIGGRSGNRGRCAQPCRLSYVAVDTEGNPLTNNKHILSPKDMCTLNILPDIIRSGVYSLKIEGRMKSPEYTAGVVSIYRKYVDMYLENNGRDYRVEDEDITKLMDLYNRGNFSTGYYNNYNGPKLMSMDRPNHQGTKALRSLGIIKGKLSVTALEDINPQDVIEVDKSFNWTSGDFYRKGVTFSINPPRNLKVKKDDIYYRIRNNSLIEDITNSYIGALRKCPITLRGSFKAGAKAWVEAFKDDICVKVEGAVVEKALKSPTDIPQIKKQLLKLGNTMFEATEVMIEADEDIFVPVMELNQLRRAVIDNISEALAKRRYSNEDKCNGV